MSMPARLALLTLLAVPLTACSEAPTASAAAAPAAETTNTSLTPEQTIAHMIELAEQGEWGRYVDEYYGEQHKFRPGQDDRAKVVEMLSRRGERLITGLRAFEGIEATISEDDAQATFTLPDGGTYILHRAADGRWQFHL